MPCPSMFACEHANVAATRSCFARDWREHLRDRKQIRGGGVGPAVSYDTGNNSYQTGNFFGGGAHTKVWLDEILCIF
jgi:hypothetical protein